MWRKLFIVSSILLLAGMTLISCGDERESPTLPVLPSPTPVVTPPVVESPPPTSNTEEDLSSLAPEYSFDKKGTLTVKNITNHDVNGRICSYQVSEPYSFNNQKRLGEGVAFNVPPKQTSVIPLVITDDSLECNTEYVVQLDVYRSKNACPTDPFSLGYIPAAEFVKYKTEDCECIPEYRTRRETTKGEFGPCIENDDVGDGCFKSRVVTVTSTTTNSCTHEKVVEVKTSNEVEQCQCTCKEEWVELEPEITYGEWSECTSIVENHITPSPPTCEGIKVRKVTTIIKEYNECSQETRIKSESSVAETESCYAPCALCHTEDPKFYASCEGVECGTKRWLCTNIPPEFALDHYPDHFNSKDHADFWGACNYDVCYKIIN